MADTEGFDEFINFLSNLPEEVNNAIDAGLKKTATMAVSDIKSITPVGVYPKGSGRTGGTLKRGWEHTDVENKTITVGNSVSYAKCVEDGHRTRSGGFLEGKHMMRDTMTKYEDRDVLGNSISAELDKILK